MHKKKQNSELLMHKKTGETTVKREHSGIRNVFTNLKGSKFLSNKGTHIFWSLEPSLNRMDCLVTG